MEGYEVFETEDYIKVQPKGRVVDARKCKTFWKREGWNMENVINFYKGE